MMATTHILIGGALGALSTFFIPQHTATAIIAGLTGGLLPDLDMLLEHRKTLHFPAISTILTTLLLPLLILHPSTPIIALFFLLLSISIHSLMDALGGGDELRPWQEHIDHAVYNHLTQKWIKPRRIMYEASTADVLLSLTAAGTLLLLLNGWLTSLIISLTAVSILYALFREHILQHIPEHITTYSGAIKHILKTIKPNKPTGDTHGPGTAE